MPLASWILAIAPSLPVDVAERASAAIQCSHGPIPRVVVIADFSQPSSARRLWALDLVDRRLLAHDWVSHGWRSDLNRDGIPESFSNIQDSHQTSLGLYRIAEPYLGQAGPSYRLDGLTPGFNDRARERAVVLHPSEHVRPGWAGRSQGCPAVRPEVIDRLADHAHDSVLWVDGGPIQSPGCGVCPAI